MSNETVTLPIVQIKALCKAYSNVAGVRMGDEMDVAQHGSLVQDIQSLQAMQRLTGIEMMADARMDRAIEAFRPKA